MMTKKKWIAIVALILTAVIVILLLRSCGGFTTEPQSGSQGQTQPPVQGDFQVGGKQEQPTTGKETEAMEYITFSGYGKFEVSANCPNVEMSNPEGNSVDMIFTLTDQASGDIIARTSKVRPGDYVYVNVM